MRSLDHLFLNNRAWSERIRRNDPEFFASLSRQQKPRYLRSGCADSRVPANEIVGLLPGELFVHRNIAEVAMLRDLGATASNAGNAPAATRAALAALWRGRAARRFGIAVRAMSWASMPAGHSRQTRLVTWRARGRHRESEHRAAGPRAVANFVLNKAEVSR